MYELEWHVKIKLLYKVRSCACESK